MAAKKGKDGKSVSNFMYEEGRSHKFDLKNKRPRHKYAILTGDETKEEREEIAKKEIELIKRSKPSNNLVATNFKWSLNNHRKELKITYMEKW